MQNFMKSMKSDDRDCLNHEQNHLTNHRASGKVRPSQIQEGKAARTKSQHLQTGRTVTQFHQEKIARQKQSTLNSLLILRVAIYGLNVVKYNIK